VSTDRGSAAVVVQTAGIVAAWLVPVVLHAGNDGLWYLGDAARHAITGLFWWDFLSALPSDPADYVLRYYARYPTIVPLSYPPVFYLLEGVAFRIFGVSPFVAKGLVLCFALVGSLYVAAWLRRYVAREAGWGGALMALQPGVVVWSNAVMLNIPAMTLGVIALYHMRRWLDEGASSAHLWLAIGAAVVTVLTYFPAALVGVVVGAWLIIEGRTPALWRRHRPAVLLGIGGVLLVLLLIIQWVPLPFALGWPSWVDLAQQRRWLLYVWAQPRLLSTPTLIFAAVAFPVAWGAPRWRRDLLLLTSWIGIAYCCLSYLYSQHPRYALLMTPAFILLAMIGLRGVVDALCGVLGFSASRCLTAALLALVAFHAYAAQFVPVPSITGFRDIARFVLQESPTDRVFYEGGCDGIFTFYVRAQDPNFTHVVVRGSKLLYASAVLPTFRLQEHVASSADVIRAFESECGCAWVALEEPESEEDNAAVRYLREAVRGPSFRLVRSFPIHAPAAHRVDIYQYLGRIDTPDELRLPFPILGDGQQFRARPIERR